MHSVSKGCLTVLLMMSWAIFMGAPTVGASGEIRIGEIDPLTGKLAKHGQEIHAGIQMAVEEANEAGGIQGRKVVLLTRDDQSRPEVALNQAQDLILRGKVVALVGGYVDSLVGPLSQLALRHKVPYVASASLQKGLTQGPPNPYFFRISHLKGISDPLCRFIPDVLRAERIGIFHAATPGATELTRELFKCLRSAGEEIAVIEKFRPGTPDFSPLLLKLKQKRVDVLVVAGFFPDHLILVRQIREQHIPLKAYIGPWGIAYPSFIQEMGSASENLIGMCAWNPGITLPGTEVESDRFVKAFQKRFDRPPTTTVMHGYTSCRVLLHAISQVLQTGAPLDRDRIAEALRRVDLVLPMEHVVFDDRGDPLHYTQVVVQIRQGRLVPVYPPDRASVSTVYPLTAPEP